MTAILNATNKTVAAKALAARAVANGTVAKEVLAAKKAVGRAQCRATSYQSVADTPVIFYKGQRIYFRPLELEDEPLLRRYINHPEVWSTLGHRLPMSASREREWLESLGKNNTDYLFGIVVKENNRLIGTTGLHQINTISRRATFGIYIGDLEYQNRGYGSEALQLCLRYGFEELNLNRIGLWVYSHNWRAIRLYQRAGFVHEGCSRQAAFVHGKYRDTYSFAMLRDEWDRLYGPE